MSVGTVDWFEYQILDTMRDLSMLGIFIIMYILAITTVYHAVRERCRNRELIVTFTVVGMILQSIYLPALYNTLQSLTSHTENNGTNITSFSGILCTDYPKKESVSGFQNVFSIYKQASVEDKEFYADLIAYLREDTTQAESLNTANLQTKSEKHVTEDVTDSFRDLINLFSDDAIESESSKVTSAHDNLYNHKENDKNFYNQFLSYLISTEDTITDRLSHFYTSDRDIHNKKIWCLDLRLIALLLSSIIFLSLLLACVRQNMPEKQQTSASWCVILYYYVMTCIVARMYIVRTSDLVPPSICMLQRGTPLFSVCSQEASSQILPFVLETVFLYGLTMAVLSLTVLKNTEGVLQNKYPVFEECRPEDGGTCGVCGNELLLTLLKCYGVILLIARPAHFTYTFITNGYFADVLIVICDLVAYGILIVNNLCTMFSKSFKRSNVDLGAD